mmetsp:Transcript_63927/g.187527  ORF Transcript_63927/g.187527 Transcript_63927/m.187527 type:complete len:441 (-) Transcript_63927:165-1487(-)
MAALKLPIGARGKDRPNPEQDALVAEKFSNFRSAVETGKGLIEEDHGLRTKRYSLFEKYASAAPGEGNEDVAAAFAKRENQLVNSKCKQWSTGDFEEQRVLGEGAFGTVHLVREKGSGTFLALKQMRKARYAKKNVRERAFCERDVLSAARTRWFVELFATFQDDDHIYMVMEFVQGGDLFKHLEARQFFTVQETCFYMAELLEALDTVHRHGFVHRDVKPDNIVLCATGHLKLLDFGLCKAATEADAKSRWDRVGTPQYMAPESWEGCVTPGGDIWALGVVLYQCLYGNVPFHAGGQEGTEAIAMIAAQVKHVDEVLPKKLKKAKALGRMSAPAEQLLLGIVCPPERRLSAEKVRRHPFFFGVDFARVHLTTPPFAPEVRGPGDASNFDNFGTHRLPSPSRGANLEWAHYEFDRNLAELQRPEAVRALFAGQDPGTISL